MGEKFKAETFCKGHQGEKDQNSELHTQYPQSPRLGEIISQHYSLCIQRTRKLTGGFLYPIAHALIMAAMCHKNTKEFAFHKPLTFTSLTFPTERALLCQHSEKCL